MGTMNQLFGGGNPPKWVSGTYQEGYVMWSPTDYQYYMNKTTGVRATDPASDPTNWQPTGERAIKSIQRGAFNGTAGGSITISAVNMLKSELRWLGGYASSAGAFSDVPRLQLTSTTAITVSAVGNSSSTAWELTERY